MSKKMIKSNKDKVIKKNKKFIIGISVLAIVILLFFLLKPIKIFVHSESSFKKIGVIDEYRSVYTYNVKKVLIFPSMNEKMSTEDFLNGTFESAFIWDGGTSVNQGIGFIVVDCQDNFKQHKSSPIIITTKEFEDSAINFCHSYT